MENVSSAAPHLESLNINQKAWKFILEANSQNLDQLNRIAIKDGSNTYTYRLMFRQWDRYASVFTALGMTGENRARVGVIGSASAEVIFVMYALNMVGAEMSFIAPYTIFKPERLKQTIVEENLTDFIITDDFAMPEVIQNLISKKKELGLRNVILLHLPGLGSMMPGAMGTAMEAKYMMLKSMFWPICMDTLLSTYANTPVDYITEENSETAFILHTSGTTKGVGKPVVLSDRAFNAVPVSLARKTELAPFMEDPTSGLAVDLSSAYGVVDQVHMPLALSGTIAVVPGGILNPTFYKAIPEFKITFLFAVSAALDGWMKLPANTEFDFSSLRCIVVGGAAVSANDKQRYCEFLKKHGCKNFVFLNGYGISEMGGACIISTPDIKDESIGYLLPGYDLRLYDEDNKKYYSLKDVPCEGVLYLTSPSCASPKLDDKEILNITTIDGKPFVCTNDAVSVDETGKITYLGRARRYFIHEEGKNFDAGKVETEMSRQPGIKCSCVVPVFVKITHDNIPMLCVEVLDGEQSALDTVCNALYEVFVNDKLLSEDNIPPRVLISPYLPRNANGKIDMYGITQGQVDGDIYEVKQVRIGKKINGIKLVLFEDKTADMIKEVFDGIKADMKDSLPFNNSKTEMEKNVMKQNFDPFAPFTAMSQMGSQMMSNWMNQQAGTDENKPAEMFKLPQLQQLPLPNFQQLSQIAGQLVNQKISQVVAYAYQMSQVSAQMFDQLYTQHNQMVQQAYDQDKEMIKQIDKMVRQEKKEKEAEKAEKKAEKSAEKTAEKSAEKTAEKAAEKPAEKKAEKAEKTEKKADKAADKAAEKAAEKPAAK